MRRYGLRVAALGYLLLLLAIPVGMVFYRMFEDGLSPVWEELTSPAFLHALRGDADHRRDRRAGEHGLRHPLRPRHRPSRLHAAATGSSTR